MDSPTRRRVLAALAILPLAGCTDADSGNPDGADGSGVSDTPTTDAGKTATDTTADEGSSDGGTATTTDGPDLREANVTGVAVESVGDRSFRFDVSLLHDDDGEDGYANWWQIERLDGTQLGRRKLLHSHGTREFTRSETVAVPEGLDCVVVRGHDQTHGYGGQAAIVTLDGAVSLRRQGEEPTTFGPEDCP